MPLINPRPRLPPPPSLDRGFGAVQKLVQSFFGPDKSNGKVVDGNRKVTKADWDEIIAASRQDGGVGGQEFDLMFNALHSMTLSKRIPVEEGKRVLAQLMPSVDVMKAWPPKEQLTVLKQIESAGRTAYLSPNASLPVATTKIASDAFAAQIATATAKTNSMAMLQSFVSDYNQINELPITLDHLRRSAQPTTVEEVRVGNKVVGQVITTSLGMFDPKLGKVGTISSLTYLGPTGRVLNLSVTASPALNKDFVMATIPTRFRIPTREQLKTTYQRIAQGQFDAGSFKKLTRAPTGSQTVIPFKDVGINGMKGQEDIFDVRGELYVKNTITEEVSRTSPDQSSWRTRVTWYDVGPAPRF